MTKLTIQDIEGMKKCGEEIGILVELRAEAPDMWCREYTQSLINQRKLNIIEYCESLLKNIKDKDEPR
jgi:hypothetical protein